MKRNGLDAMAAFVKLLVLIAIFFSASNANAFTSLSPVAGNQVQENHWFQFVEPMSKTTNKPTGKPTKQTELPNILTSKQGKYSVYRKSRMQSFQARLLF
jgi:hypothetical protein